jgi:hypothetical protein
MKINTAQFNDFKIGQWSYAINPYTFIQLGSTNSRTISIYCFEKSTTQYVEYYKLNKDFCLL